MLCLKMNSSVSILILDMDNRTQPNDDDVLQFQNQADADWTLREPNGRRTDEIQTEPRFRNVISYKAFYLFGYQFSQKECYLNLELSGVLRF